MSLPAAVSKRPDRCTECGIRHERADPHDPESGTYRAWVRLTFGRDPTWQDALAHCPRQVREVWEETLRLNGDWSEP